MVEIAQKQVPGLLTLGLIGTVWTMTATMLTLNKSFQRSQDVKERRPFWKLRLLALTLSVTATLIIALVLSLLFFGLHVVRMPESSFGYSHLVPLLIRRLRILLAFGFTTVLVTHLYLALSNVPQKIWDGLQGALFFAPSGFSLLMDWVIT